MIEGQKNDQSAKEAISLLMYVTLTITAVTFITAVMKTNGKMNVFDFSLNAVDNIPYCVALILVLLSALPFCILLLQKNNLTVMSMIFDKKELPKDILFGLLGIALSGLVTLLMSPLQHMYSTLPQTPPIRMPLSTIVLRFVALSLVSGILKELYLRGLSMHVIGKSIGEGKALFLINILFGIIDWYNFGDSFLSGLIWCCLYKKRPRLIVPMIAHMGINAIGVIFYYYL